MTADSQSIASLAISASVLNVVKIPQRVNDRMVSRMKKVYEDSLAHLYVCMFLLFGVQDFSSNLLIIKKVINTPNVIPNLASSPSASINEGE